MASATDTIVSLINQAGVKRLLKLLKESLWINPPD